MHPWRRGVVILPFFTLRTLPNISPTTTARPCGVCISIYLHFMHGPINNNIHPRLIDIAPPVMSSVSTVNKSSRESSIKISSWSENYKPGLFNLIEQIIYNRTEESHSSFWSMWALWSMFWGIIYLFNNIEWVTCKRSLLLRGT